MSGASQNGGFIPVNMAVLTVSDTRTAETDTSGRLLAERLAGAGHRLTEKVILPDSVYQIRALVSKWIADPQVQVVIITGGTGMTDRDHTPEAITPRASMGSANCFVPSHFRKSDLRRSSRGCWAGLPMGPLSLPFPAPPTRASWRGMPSSAPNWTVAPNRATSSNSFRG
jgi:molybdenum cofactor synthesis domain-containing protein